MNVLMAHEITAGYKIVIVKEEGDTSHMNKAYDPQVPKYKNTHISAAVHALSPDLGLKMDRWYLISMAINDWNSTKKDSWIDSFKKVNMDPHTCVPFNVCIQNLMTVHLSVLKIV